ncbi:PASTA domain-containing protein [Corynebacterium sp. TAE3-ERU12]|uniref:PASTA domain-containing protein n=1 Tax=Corynebacterium sp. TAE3-ERU12 TaxID=2849491 RepID=UPI001C49752D|nr:PASTA domain-containing protein [Corynebacterium sp. TAE3-ERU12]MBV7295516.1 PASTA domain-containing protein [Corynebacterium sp. TAE3-ERU12]
MTDNRDNRDPYGEDNPTEYIPRENSNGAGPGADSATGSNAGDDAPTQFFGRPDAANNEPPATAWSETRQAPAPGADPEGPRDATGQYWAPLTPEERGYADAEYAGRGYQGGGYAGSSRTPRPNPVQGGQGRTIPQPQDSNSSAWPIAIGAIVLLIVVVAALLFVFNNDDNPPPAATTSPTTTSVEPETTEPESSLNDEIDSLRDEIESMRENPPEIPGLPGGEVSEQVIPDAAGKSPAEVELNLRRLGFNDITVFDANGEEVNSLIAVTGTVATIDPPSGTTASTDQPVRMYLE